MKIFNFHLMPYANLDLKEAEKYRAVWVVLPNTFYDPKKGHELYNRYLDELELSAELGFDGISVNEHHQNAYGLMPSPDRKSTRLNSSHIPLSRMPSSA